MSTLFLAGAFVALAAYLLQKNQEKPLLRSRFADTSDAHIVLRDRNTESELTLWNEAWDVSVSPSGRADFTVREVGNRGTGLVVALAKEWRRSAAGGVAFVLNDGIPAPFAGDSQRALIVQSRSYAATLPYTSRPANEASYMYNHVLRPGRSYWIQWSPSRLVLGSGSTALLTYNRLPQDDNLRYLAFGVCGVEQLVQCPNGVQCKQTQISGVTISVTV